MKNILSLGFVITVLLAMSCKKNEPTTDTPSTARLIVSNDFNWSASRSGLLTVTFTNPFNASLEYEYLMIVNEQGKVLERKVIADNSATFNLVLPVDANYFLYFPITEDRLKINALGNVNMLLGPSVEYIYPTFKSSNVASCTPCGTPIQNAGAELPYLASAWTLRDQSDVPGWKTTASDGKIEFWVSGFNGVPAQEGRQFFELNANMVAALYQELCLAPGSIIKWSVWHRGRLGIDVADVRIGGSLATAQIQATMSDGTAKWGYYSGTYNVPLNQTRTFFVFNSVSAAGGNQSIGNFLDNFQISCDADGDGVIDRWDDLPADPNATFVSNFPEGGKQILAFEDLWPSLGDFDFNDLVVSNQVKITKNAANKPLKAEFKISIDAIGAGMDNGLAMMLYKPTKTSFTGNIIASITGDAVTDPGNVNGLILTNDIHAKVNRRYQNNGVGPVGVPDTIRFTVNFNTAAADFIPELYIFRTNDRGHEVHRSGFPRTSTIKPGLFNTQNDAGDYKTSTGIPWAMEIVTNNKFKCAIEKIDILLTSSLNFFAFCNYLNISVV